MTHYKCKNCHTWMHEVCIKTLDHHEFIAYVCLECNKGYEVIK